MRKHLLKLASLLSVALAVALFAPQRAAADDDDDPPSRVARLSYTYGNVSFNPAGTDDWVTAVVKVWTDNGARAELNIGSATIRLSSNTGFSFLNLDDRTAQIRITEGALNVRVRRLENDETFEIDTPNLAFSILRPGSYKIDVNEAGDTTVVVVRDGEGEVTGGGSAYAIHPRETGTFSGADQLDADIQRFGDNDDDFDHWCGDRDRREDRSQSSRYVSSDVIGYEDLDDNGGWRPVPEYGTVWFPHTTIVGWAPYRYGHWVWISPWGWTWVDDASWGFAPFHYGRWVYAGYWAWVPGPVYVRPIYAPALVAWFGGVGLSFGNGYGWCPLGYGEPFIPWYGGSRHYFRNVNITNTRITNITNITNNYYDTNYHKGGGPRRETPYPLANLKAPGAVTAVPQHTIVNSLPVAREAVPLSEKDARRLAEDRLGSKVDIRATRASILGANAGKPTVTPPERTFTRPVVSKIAPPPSSVRMPKEEVAELDKADRPMAAPKLEKSAPVAAPASGRYIPRPPSREDRGDNPKTTGAAMATRGVPKPPSATGAPETRESHSGAMHSVPRPAENSRSEGEGRIGMPNSRISRTDTSDVAGRGPSAAPAMRPVPRPPTSENRRDIFGDSGRGPSASPAMQSVPRAPANDNQTISPNTDMNRGSRPSGVSVRGGSADFPRPSGPVA